MMLKLWLVSKFLPILKISEKEEYWSKDLSSKKVLEYRHSRSYIRSELSSVLNLDPLKIPLVAKPNKAPFFLDKKLGYLSISHCSDFLFFGWANYPIGLDIENIKRKINIAGIVDKYFFREEKNYLNNLIDGSYKKNALKISVTIFFILVSLI